MTTLLVTGGAGYVGSHTCVELLEAGYELVVLDNLCNSSREALHRVERITGKPLIFVEGDIRHAGTLKQLFARYTIDTVVHFAGLKVLGESVSAPLSYYDNNIGGTLTLLTAMRSHGVKSLLFSSTAAVYGDPHQVPITEDFPLSATNPYGRSKLIVEDMLRDLHRAEPDWSIMILRYFNPVGAHESGLIGEDPQGTPTNLMPFIAQVAVGKREFLSVYGNDYPTADGTGVRDYLHVVDLAIGHAQAIDALDKATPGQLCTCNLGTGRGYSVLDVVRAFERVSGRKIPHVLADRRPGDIAACYADPAQAERELGWKAVRGLDEMCADVWRWQSGNPQGYGAK